MRLGFLVAGETPLPKVQYFSCVQFAQIRPVSIQRSNQIAIHAFTTYFNQKKSKDPLANGHKAVYYLQAYILQAPSASLSASPKIPSHGLLLLGRLPLCFREWQSSKSTSNNPQGGNPSILNKDAPQIRALSNQKPLAALKSTNPSTPKARSSLMPPAWRHNLQ